MSKPTKKAVFSQFMTPSIVAHFMASLFPPSTTQTCRLLDAGAGVGVLACAFLHRWVSGYGFNFGKVEATAYEIDTAMHGHLARHLAGYSNVTSHILAGDYIKLATVEGMPDPGYTHIILNPPYKKIDNHSVHRLVLRSVGIEAVNLYSAFVALAITQAAPGGQIVAIIPRSFCNGPYYRQFRNFILERTAVRHIHLFTSRSKVFKDDGVLQETIIIRLERSVKHGLVTVTTSTDNTFYDTSIVDYPFREIIHEDDKEFFIHIPAPPEADFLNDMKAFSYALSDIGVHVSTGPVVDFRIKDHLKAMPEAGTAPLLYPHHFRGHVIQWPIEAGKKPNAILCNKDTQKWLYPSGFYTVVRRFSSKEEKRRIVASVVDPAVFSKAQKLGFENHLNVFHSNKEPLTETLARGLSVFLNSTAVDNSFRRFSGLTQVNATDLKYMKYPSRKVLIQLGEWVMQKGVPCQAQIDAKLETLIA